VSVSIGEEIVLSGGYRGTVDEILVTGVLVKVVETGATVAVPWGEKVRRANDSGRLAPGEGDPSDPEVVERLKKWRLEQARSQGVPAYVVFNDRTLEAIASIRPSSEAALLGVPGIGPAKLDAYGEQLLDLLAGD
jgi:superfamily II DNA helicase RecQ